MGASVFCFGGVQLGGFLFTPCVRIFFIFSHLLLIRFWKDFSLIVKILNQRRWLFDLSPAKQDFLLPTSSGAIEVHAQRNCLSRCGTSFMICLTGNSFVSLGPTTCYLCESEQVHIICRMELCGTAETHKVQSQMAESWCIKESRVCRHRKPVTFVFRV